MHCPACSHENPEGSKFCSGCGASLARSCGACGTALPADARFCNQCGASVEAPAAAPTPPGPAPRAPRDYTPRHLADKILTQKAALEGERKQVTVLFADVKSSLDLQGDVDAELWHGIMDRFFQILADGVHRFEGTINQYTGDGIMALFGAPIAHEDHAQRACYASLHLCDALREYARELRREHGFDFSTRIGLNSGEVVVGKIGDDLRMDYTAQGQTVGLAARVESLAEPGKVYLTGETAERVKGYFELEDLGEFKLKGIAEPVPVFELVGMGALRTRFDVSRARGLSRFVGRDSDMQTLESALAAARQGKGRALGVVANAGVGKSRLCFEFVQQARAQGVVVFHASGVAHGRNIPLLPVLEIFRAYFGVDERDDPRRSREKIAGRLLLIDESFRDVLPPLFEFLGIPDPERPAPPMDAEARQRRVVAVIRRLIERGNPEGFIILIEDLHWLDPASEAFVAAYVDAIANGAGLLLLNFRPEYRAEWMGKTWYQQLPLEPLRAEAIRELLADLLGGDPSVSGLADRIHERTQGNPYFTEEIVRSLIESGALEGTRGRYRLSTPIEALEVPYSVHAVLSARIDRLPEREKQLLQTAAVIGKEFAEPILTEVAGLPKEALTDALARLCSAEFIHQQSLYPVAEYAFAHPLTQEVALGSMLHEARRRIHASVARAIQAAEPEHAEANAALLAHHWEAAGEPLEAARWHQRAAQWLRTKHLDTSLHHWQAVRELVRALPESEEALGLRLGACAQILVTGGFRLGLSEAAAQELYEEGLEIARRQDSLGSRVVLETAYASRLMGLGRVRQGYDLYAQALALSDEMGFAGMQAGARGGVVYSLIHLGRMREALGYVDEGEKLTGGDLQLGREAFGFGYLVFFVAVRAMIQCHDGRVQEGRRELERALRLARESGIPENLGWALGSLVDLGIWSGETDFEELGNTLAAARESLRIAEEIGSVFSRAIGMQYLGAAHVLVQDWEEAERAVDAALELAKSRQTCLEHLPNMLLTRSGARLGAGRAAEAVSDAEESVALCQERGQIYYEALGQIALARALAAQRGGRAREAAERALTRAEELVAECNLLSAAPWILEARARLAEACGDAGAQQAFLREALEGYRQIGATGHSKRLAAALGEA